MPFGSSTCKDCCRRSPFDSQLFTSIVKVQHGDFFYQTGPTTNQCNHLMTREKSWKIIVTIIGWYSLMLVFLGHISTVPCCCSTNFWKYFRQAIGDKLNTNLLNQRCHCVQNIFFLNRTLDIFHILAFEKLVNKQFISYFRVWRSATPRPSPLLISRDSRLIVVKTASSPKGHILKRLHSQIATKNGHTFKATI